MKRTGKYTIYIRDIQNGKSDWVPFDYYCERQFDSVYEAEGAIEDFRDECECFRNSYPPGYTRKSSEFKVMEICVCNPN